MAKVRNEEFRREAMRIELTSGQPRRQVAADLGVDFSTLAKCI
jgi:transposase